MLRRFLAFGFALSAALTIPRTADPATWTETVLHVFGFPLSIDFHDGSTPSGKLIVDNHGNFYGATVYGGMVGPSVPAECRISGCGTIYELSPPAPGGTYWTEQLLHIFTGGTDAEYPGGALTVGAGGTLYGAANSARASRLCAFGCVFALVPVASGGFTESVIYRWSGASGAGVAGDLIVDATGAIFGATGGGTHGAGTIFKLTPPATVTPPGSPASAWTKQVLYNFTGGIDGGNPEGGLLADSHGALYGAAGSGGTSTACNFQGHYPGNSCGVIFKLTPPVAKNGPWTETVLHTFTGKLDGGIPNYGLIADSTGALYGTTQAGGKATLFDLTGVAFKLIPPKSLGAAWTYQVIHTFGGPGDGFLPLGDLIAENGFKTLYGTTNEGVGYGTVYRLTLGTKGWTETVLHNFAYTDGGEPQVGLVEYGAGTLFGTTPYGGAYNGGGDYPFGTAFRVTDR